MPKQGYYPLVELMACRTKLSNGQPCRATPLRGGDYCFMHDPASQSAQRSAAALGGKAPHKNHAALPMVDLSTRQGVAELLALTINEVRLGIIELRTANCIGFLSAHLLKALESKDGAEEKLTLEDILRMEDERRAANTAQLEKKP